VLPAALSICYVLAGSKVDFLRIFTFSFLSWCRCCLYQLFQGRTTMGTIGLNFGSPTGGQGFDVAATVSQIVTGYQAVETPWKNSLTNLTG
jgi:hypothetical protein